MNIEELLKPIALYHGSPIPGLKVIKPMDSSVDPSIGKAVYATSNLGAACLFALDWTDDDATLIEHDDKIIFSIRTQVVEKPISIYLIQKKNFIQIQDSMEYYSLTRQGVLWEKRIEDPFHQAIKHGITIIRSK